MNDATVSVSGLISMRQGESSRMELRVGNECIKLTSNSPHVIIDVMNMIARMLETGELPECVCEICGDIDTCEKPQKYAYLAEKEGK